jgi:hypothetical protein
MPRGARGLDKRTSDALWPWAEGLQPAIVWLRAAGYLVEIEKSRKLMLGKNDE